MLSNTEVLESIDVWKKCDLLAILGKISNITCYIISSLFPLKFDVDYGAIDQFISKASTAQKMKFSINDFASKCDQCDLGII